jgi:hypothetical protein
MTHQSVSWSKSHGVSDPTRQWVSMNPAAFDDLIGALAGIPDLRRGLCVGDDPRL